VKMGRLTQPLGRLIPGYADGVADVFDIWREPDLKDNVNARALCEALARRRLVPTANVQPKREEV